MRQISASELGAFLYCRRSWYYTCQGEKSDNQAVMDLGSRVHHSHSRGVRQSQLLRWLALMLVVLALLIFLWSVLS